MKDLQGVRRGPYYCSDYKANDIYNDDWVVRKLVARELDSVVLFIQIPNCYITAREKEWRDETEDDGNPGGEHFLADATVSCYLTITNLLYLWRQKWLHA